MIMKEEFQSYKHKVQYYETDQMGIVHHSNYIRWLEEARTDVLEQAGMSYDLMEKKGVIIPVLEVHTQYRSMTRYGETVEITVHVKQYNGITLQLEYEIRDETSKELRCVGETKHCFLDKEGKLLSLKRSREDVHQIFEKL